MVPLAATASDGAFTAFGVGSGVSVENTVQVATSMALTVSLVPATSSTLPSGVSAALLTGAGVVMRPVMVPVPLAVVMTATVPSRFVTYARAPADLTMTSVGDVPTPVTV